MINLKNLNTLKQKRIFKILLKVLLGLFISLSLTLVCILFTPSIFKSTLYKGLALLPENKFIEYKVQKKAELAKEWLQVTDATLEDERFFDKLRMRLASQTTNQDTFFAHMFVVHDYPSRCLFTIFGKHRTMDVTWTVQGIHCKGVRECSNPDFMRHCSDHKRSHR